MPSQRSIKTENRLASLADAKPDPGPELTLAERIEKLPRDVGWMLFGVGFAGFVAPGIFGLPFMAAGGMILWPNTVHRLQRLMGKQPHEKSLAPGMKQVMRFLDDLERRYPKPARETQYDIEGR